MIEFKGIPRRQFMAGSAAGLTLLGSHRSVFAQQSESQGMKEVEDAARREGRFVWYDAIPAQQGAGVIAAFQKKYPEIKGEFIELSSTQRVARINQESNAGGPTADFFIDLPQIAMSLVAQGFARAVDWTRFGIQPSPDSTPNPYLLLTHATPTVFIYNSRKISDAEAPKTYEDTLNPKWKNRVGIWSIPYGPIQMIAAWGEEGVADYFKRFSAISPRLFANSHALADSVGAGEVDMGYFLPYNTVLPTIQKGAPVKIVWIEPVALGALYGVLPKYGANPNAGKLFLSWIASPDGAKAWEQHALRGNPYVQGTEMNQLLGSRNKSQLSADVMVRKADQLNTFSNKIIGMLQGR